MKVKIAFTKILTFLTVSIFISCGSGHPPIEDFNKSFIGSIKDGDTICLTLSKTNTTIRGECLVKGERNPLKISGAINETGMIIFNTHNEQGAMVGGFECRLYDSVIAGKFMRPGSYEARTFSLAACMACDSAYVRHTAP